MNERSKNGHNTSGDQEINPGDAAPAPDPVVESRQDQTVDPNSEPDFGKKSEKLISDTVGRLAMNLRN